MESTPSIDDETSINEIQDVTDSASHHADFRQSVSLLTGGDDKPYVFGLTNALLAAGVTVDIVGSDVLDIREFKGRKGIRFLNLRGSLNPDVGIAEKIIRILRYYARLVRYAAAARAPIFHILWNNKFLYFDRTFLMLFYRLLKKRVVLTAHNVNAEKRDGTDSSLNRLTLRIQYSLCHRIFVHTKRMKEELICDFGIPDENIVVIPFGINNAVPKTSMNSAHAKAALGLSEEDRAILFFGRITPYKGLEFLISAIRQLRDTSGRCRLIIAGKPDQCDEYWSPIAHSLSDDAKSGRIILRATFIPDEETEVYFKAADVLVLPYRQIYQSGVLFLAHSFGLPVLASDVGSLKEGIVEGENGYVFKPEDPADLSRAIEAYFSSDLYAELNSRRQEICARATAKHSWDVVGQITVQTYSQLVPLATDRSYDKPTY